MLVCSTAKPVFRVGYSTQRAAKRNIQRDSLSSLRWRALTRRYKRASDFPNIFGFPQLSVLTVWVLAQSKALPKPPVVQGHASTDKQLPQDQVLKRLAPETSRGCRALTVWRYRRHRPLPQHLLISAPLRRASAKAAPSASGFAGSPQFVRPSMNLERPTLLR